MKPRIALLLSSARIRACPRAPHAPICLGIERGVRRKYSSYSNSNARPAVELDHHVTQEEKDDWERRLEEDKGKQIRTPWHREGSDTPPVARPRSAGAMTKGAKLRVPSNKR